MSLQIFLGRRNMLIICVGIAWTIVFNNTSLLAWERKLFFQLVIRAQTRSLISSKALYLLEPTIIGNPRYFSLLLQRETLAKVVIWSHTGWLVFELKK